VLSAHQFVSSAASSPQAGVTVRENVAAPRPRVLGAWGPQPDLAQHDDHERKWRGIDFR
jgi:hypothetical protein